MRSQIQQLAISGTDKIILPHNPNRISVIFGLFTPAGGTGVVQVAFGSSAVTLGHAIIYFNSTSNVLSMFANCLNLDNTGDQLKAEIHVATTGGLTGTLSVLECFE